MDPDPHGSGSRCGKFGGENKNAWKIYENCNFIKCGQTPLFITVEQSFLSILTLHELICYKFC